MAESKKPVRGCVLVVEDEDYVRASLGELIESRGFQVVLESSGERGLATLERMPVDVVLSDLRMPGMDGLELTRQIRARFPSVPVVILTGNGTIASAVECTAAGASDYILKPASPAALEVAFERAMAGRALRREVEYLRTSSSDLAEEGMPIGKTPVWTRMIEMARAAAGADSTVLILGESGTGKELMAKLIHRLSPRAKGPCISVNCAAVPHDMWESEFFGHRRGSFTGAVSDREGRFLLADGGTLFMDEIGSMPLAGQAKILRVLQEREFERLGDQRPTRVDVRVVAATNSDLDADVKDGKFREDLFYRLNVIRLDLPPLRERREDIPLLAEKFVHELAMRAGRPAPRIDDRARDELMTYPWPGNVRELQNVLERAVILNPGDMLVLPDLPQVAAPSGGGAGVEGGLNLRTVLARREKEVVIEALRRAGGVRKEAARLLGIDQRNLPYYIRKHEIDPDRIS